MSDQSYHDYGFGFNFSEFDASCEKAGIPIGVEDVERLLEHAPVLQRDVHEYLEDIEEMNPGHEIVIDDYREFDQDYMLDLSRIFADTVREVENLPHVYATSDYDCNHYVIFGQGYPWNCNQKEKAISKDEVEAIFRKYLSILKPEAEGKFFTDIDNQSVENGG